MEEIILLEMNLQDAIRRIEWLENEVKKLRELHQDQCKINENVLEILKINL